MPTKAKSLGTVSLAWSARSGWIRADTTAGSSPAWPYGEVTCDVLSAHSTVYGSLSLYRLDLHSRSVRAVLRRAELPDLPEPVFVGAIDTVLTEAMSTAAVTDVQVRGTLVVDDKRTPQLCWAALPSPSTGPLVPRTLVFDGLPGTVRFSLRRGQTVLARYHDARPLVVVSDGGSDPLDEVLPSLAMTAGLRVEPGIADMNRLRHDVEADLVAELCGWELPGWVVPVGAMAEGLDRRVIGTGQPGPLLIRLWRKLGALHRAEAEWPQGWMYVVR